MSANTLRARYVSDTVATVPPSKLLTMLYDALVKDLVQAQEAIMATDRWQANDRLTHAQAIVTELKVSLDPTKWSGGPALMKVYDYLLEQLIAANVEKSAPKVATCRRLVEPLRDAWHQAAKVAATP